MGAPMNEAVILFVAIGAIMLIVTAKEEGSL